MILLWTIFIPIYSLKWREDCICKIVFLSNYRGHESEGISLQFWCYIILSSLTRMQLLTKCIKILLNPKLFKHSFKTFRMANTTLILWKLQLYDKGWKTIGNIFIASLQLWIIESASVFWSRSSGTIWRVCHASCRVGRHQRIFRQTSHASHREHPPCTENMFWKISRFCWVGFI